MDKVEILPPAPYKFNLEDNKRVIYLCGPHGVGKSTIMEDLRAFAPERVREQLAHMDSLQDNVTRQVWRIALHCIEHRENLVYAAKQPPKQVVLGDRCTLDDEAYIRAFAELGWLTKKERNNILNLTDKTYRKSGTPKPERFIILLPPIGWNIDRIKERWEDGVAVKWCERNFTYLNHVRNQFEYLSEFLVKKKQAIVIEETTRKGRVQRVKEWLADMHLEDFMVEGRTYLEGVHNSSGS